MVGGSMRRTAAGPVPAGWPASGSGPAGPAGSPAGRAGAAGCVVELAAVGAGGPPPTRTPAGPLRAPTRAPMIPTPPPLPETVPLLSALATPRLFDDPITR